MVAGNGLFASQHHARLSSLLTEVICEQLINTDPALQLGAFLECRSRHDVAGLSGMNSYSCRVPVEQSLNDIQFGFQRLHR